MSIGVNIMAVKKVLLAETTTDKIEADRLEYELTKYMTKREQAQLRRLLNLTYDIASEDCRQHMIQFYNIDPIGE
jgi:hypothetical protein